MTRQWMIVQTWQGREKEYGPFPSFLHAQARMGRMAKDEREVGGYTTAWVTRHKYVTIADETVVGVTRAVRMEEAR